MSTDAEMVEEVLSLREEKHQAYNERNRLVAFISKLYPSHMTRHPPDPEWDVEWLNIVCVHAPFGQLTWHIKLDELDLFSHLNMANNDWDGTTTEEKYKLIEEWRNPE